ncbi:hypothetical protein Moror_14016 [Moniliophthora roreri MCA 2997]|uniref:Uncharacterized protein n=1 Tax=Moniliophthora roreri (strain MCA 2997) TaxID=1381753 RepID=V2XQ63_MONRO|nr:hypothetical protein Moror_14016 [Moniliophthora roreri MCA 2997]
MQTRFRWLIFPHFLLPVLSLKISLSGPSTTTAPASAWANWEREDGDPSITSIGVLDITASGGPKVIRAFQVPEASRSGSFQVDLTSPGTYYLQGLKTDGSLFGSTSNTITVLQSTSLSDTRITTTGTTSVSAKKLIPNVSTHVCFAFSLLIDIVTLSFNRDPIDVEASVLSTATVSSTLTMTRTTSSSFKPASTGLPSKAESTENSLVSSESKSKTASDQSVSTTRGGPSVTSYQSVTESNLPASTPQQESNMPLGPSQTATAPTKGADRNTIILGAILGSVISFIIGMVLLVFCFRRCGHRLRMPRLYDQKKHPIIHTLFHRRPLSMASHSSSTPLRDPGSPEEVEQTPDVERALSPMAAVDISLPTAPPPQLHGAVARVPSVIDRSDTVTYVDSSVSRRASLNTDITVLKSQIATQPSKSVLSTFAAPRELVAVNVDRDLPEIPPLESSPRHSLENTRSRKQGNNGNEVAIHSLIVDPPPPYQSSSDED